MDIFSKYKTSILVSLFLIFSIFIGFLIFRIFFGPVFSPGQEDDPTYTGGFPTSVDGEGNIITPIDGSGLPLINPERIPAAGVSEIAIGGLTKTTALETSPIVGANKSLSGNSLQYYNKDDGRFYKIDKNGNKILLSNQIFYNVENVTWSNRTEKAIIEYPDGSNILYDFEKEKQVTLPKHWKDFDFAPTEDKIVTKSIGLDPGNRWLAVSDADGSNARYIEPLGTKDMTVHSSWSPNNQTIAMFSEGIDFDRQHIYFVGLNNENFKSTIVQGRGFQPLWSPDGQTLMYSVYSSDNDMKPSLWLVNAKGESIGSGRKSLGLETWASKCTFSGSADVYCAVPQTLEKGAGLFPGLAESTNDSIYKINTQTNAKRLVAIPENPMTVSNIFISDDEKTLYFTDKRSQALHKIDL